MVGMLPWKLAMCLRQNVGDNGSMVRHCAFFRRHSESPDPSVLGGILVNIFRKSSYLGIEGESIFGNFGGFVLLCYVRAGPTPKGSHALTDYA